MGPGPLSAVALASIFAETELGRLLLQDAAADHDVDRDVEQSALLHESHRERAWRPHNRRRGQQAGHAGYRAQRLPPSLQAGPSFRPGIVRSPGQVIVVRAGYACTWLRMLGVPARANKQIGCMGGVPHALDPVLIA